MMHTSLETSKLCHKISPNAFRDSELSKIFWSHPGLKFSDFPEELKRRIDDLARHPVDATAWEQFWIGKR